MIVHRNSHMPRVLLALVLALTLAFGPLASAGASLFASDPALPEHAPDRVLVSFKPGTPAASKAAAHAALGAKARATIPRIGVEVIDVPKKRSVDGLVRAYLKNPNVAFAEPDFVVNAFVTPDDPLYPDQWGLPAIEAPAAWRETTGDSGVTIAILDTGIDLTHPDLAGKLVAGYDFVNQDADPTDDHGHGTIVAGIAGANGNNGIGVAGANWSAKLMPIKVLNSSGSGYWSHIAEGIIWAADNDADVVNMSLGSSGGSLTVANALAYAYDKGVTLVAASGNDGASSVSFPAAYPEVIAVGALGTKNERASYSNYGEGLSLVAPGSNINSSRMGGTYTRASGTSMAAPFVAGLAAMLKGLDPSLSPSDVEIVMQETAADLGATDYDIVYGHGRIDMGAAVNAIEAPETEPAPAPEPEPAPQDPVAEPTPDPTLEEPTEEPSPEPEPAPEEPADVTPPHVSLVDPIDGATVSGNITIVAEARDESGVARVEFYANGALIGSATSEPFRVRWNTRKASGAVTLVAVAYDSAGNSTVSSPITVIVDGGSTGRPAKKR